MNAWLNVSLGALISTVIALPVSAELPVPCGSCAGGVWVSSGNASLNNIANGIEVHQTTPQAILNWQSFNVGAGKRVDFNQPSSTAVALNRIFQSDPSKIFGSVTANGQIYLINQNGIVFGAGAQVNTQSIIASTLDVPDDVFTDIGLVNAVNENRAALEGAGSDEQIIVENGAEIRVAQDGRVLLAAPEVINRGRILADEGQTLLVGAKDKVYLEASDDDTLRGLLVEVETGGSVSNLGEIISDGGNTTLLGLAVNQSGRVQANSTLTKNGTIRLLARDDAVTVAGSSSTQRTLEARRSGELVIGSGSETIITPDASDAATASDAQSVTASRIEMMADDILIKTGASVVATGGEIEISATKNPQAPFTALSENDASIIIESGANISVSGADNAQVSAERNFVEVELRGNELRDNPVNRDGPVRGTTVVVDSRYGTEFADISAFLDATERNVSERLSTGGSIDIKSEGSIELQQGASLSAKGGVIEYLPGRDTSSFLIKDGALTNIRDADPTVRYDGVFGDVERDYQKWSVTEYFQIFGPADSAWSIGAQVPGYLEGTDAGRISLIAPSINLAGNIDLSVTPGTLQRLAPTSAAGDFRPFNELPLGGLLTLGGELGVAGDFGIQKIVFGQDAGDDDTLFLDPNMFLNGTVPRLNLSATESITIPADMHITLAPAGALSLTSGNVIVDGQVTIPAGDISFNTQSTFSVAEGNLSLGSGALLDVSGNWVNDPESVAAGSGFAPLYVDGGSVNLTSNGDLTIPAGSEIRAWGGAQIDESGAINPGRGGNINIDVAALERRLQLDGNLSAFALENGGALNISAAGFSFGVEQGPTSPFVALDSNLLNGAGFSSISLISRISGLDIAANTALEVTQQNLLLSEDFGRAESGTNIADITDIGLLPDQNRNPTSLNLVYENGGLGQPTATVSLGRGASITADLGSDISLVADTRVLIDGSIEAPGGNVTARVARPGDEIGFDANQKIWLGDKANINVDGRALSIINSDTGLRDVQLIDAGSISLEAQRGYVIGHPNANLSANAGSTLIDVAQMSNNGLASTITPIEAYTNAGTISLSSPEGIFYAGSLAATAADVAGSEAGTLSFTLDSAIREAGDLASLGLPLFPITNDQMVISETRAIPFFGANELVPNSANGLAVIRPAMLNNGFDNVVLTAKSEGNAAGLIAASSLVFDHATDLAVANSLVLDASEISVLAGHVQINAGQLSLGPIEQDYRYLPTSALGTGRFTANADSVRIIGDLFFENLAPTNALSIEAESHLQLLGNSQNADRTNLLGSIRSASDIKLTAPVIYPGTFTDFQIKNDRVDGAITIARRGNQQASIFSVAGQLTLEADKISQGGYLNAPFGQINLTGETVNLLTDSVTSVAADNTVLFGETQFSRDWIYPLFGETLLIDGAPEKSISIDADSINLQPGSTIDVSGGGDLLAVEFVPGPGGSIDITANDGNSDGSFAIIPSYGAQSLPWDPLISPGAGIELGDVIVLSQNDVIPAGSYAVLPARFSLLPGAFLLTPNSSDPLLVPGSTNLDGAGRSLIVGKRGAATTGFTDSLWTDFVVSDGAAIRNRAQYAESLANTFFAASATRPLDNGNLSLAATTALNLQGTVLSNPNGRAPAVDIVASKINIVNDRADAAADAVAILANQLSSFSSGSVLLGATRSSGSSTTTLNVLSEEINIGANTKLSGSEFILAAKDNIVVGENATIEAAGEGNDSSLDSISIDGDAALLVVSQGRRNLQRTGTIGAAGSLTTEAGSLISASGQVLIDVTGNADLSGGLVSNGGEIALGAPRISIGDAPGGTTGTVLSGSLLSQLGTANVSFRSASTFDIFSSSDLTFGNLSIDAEAIVGHLGAGESLNINADALTLSNQGSARGATRADGELRFTSTTTTFGAGTTSFDNLDKVTIAATDGMLWVGDNDVLVGGDINLAAPFFANQTSGASLNIETQSGAIDVSRLGTDVAVDDDALGGELSLRGLEINFNADALLPSGIFTAIASAGNVNLSNANIDVSGRSIDFVESLLITPGGRITVDGINIDLSSATLEAGAPGRQGGSVELLASGDINLNAASLSANGGGGSLFIDAVTLSGADAGQAIQGFNAGGFDNQLRLSLDAQDINLGLNTSITGQLISLVSGTGNVSLLGSINASGGKAGKIRAYAGNTLTVGSDATLIATASDADEIGGRVELGANGDVIVGAANIAVDGGAGGRAGSVLIRAPTVANDIAVSQFDATVTGVDFVEFEAVQTFNGASLANANALIKPSLDTFAGNIGTIEARLDSVSLPGVRVSLGAEVIDSGNLTIGDLDLINWRFGGNPGTLTIRTAGDITFDGTLGDGFVPEPFAVANGLAARDSAIFGESSSFRITSGADTTSADPMALDRALASGVTFNNGGTLRTGTGDIELATTGDLIFLDDYAIYSAGENRGAGVYGDVNREVLLHGDFLENGGNVSLEVGGNLTAENQSGVVTDWLARGALEIVAGSVGINVADIGTSWAVAFSHFNQGIGAFAGGDIDITVRGDMRGTSVYLPSTALPTGNIGSEPDVIGGGDLTLMTFGDLSGGSFHVGSGQAKINVGGKLSGGMSNPLILSASDGVYDITSRGDISFDGLVDPFLLPRSELQGLPRPGGSTPFQDPSYSAFFASFSEDAAVNFRSVSGNINLLQDIDAFESLSPFVNFTSVDVSAFSITPPTVTATSFSQSVLLSDTFSLYPSRLGTVELFAKNNVTEAAADIALINLSDANLDLLPSIATPLESLALTRQLVLDPSSHGFEAVRAGNSEPTRVVALDGFVGSAGNQDLILKLGKRTRIYAGSEIRRLQLEAQHINPDDVSVVYSAGDIIYPLARNNSNALADSQVSNLTFAGPGRADVIAAGTIDLGTSGGIRTIGDSANPALEDAGATLNVLAGIGDSPDYVAFAQEFLAPDTANHNRLIAYLKTLGVPVGTDPVASFAGLTETQQRQLAIDVFFDELVDSGVFATSSGTDDYSRGNEAIATLFPGDNYNGDLISLVSRIQTVDGGDINILVPGGDIIAGTSSVAASNPAADRIGIVVQREGDLNIFLRDDLLVEISRVFTLDGGDISIWSAEGDIDAGRGAKSALSIPGLITTFDAEGNLVTEFPPSIQGSGIRAAVATPGRSPGDVFLFAPQGAVIAGDAGIGSAGNLTIGATEVVGADNIDVGGVSVGVPAADVGSVAAGLTGASDSSASAAKSAQDSTGDSLASSEEAIGEALAQGALSFISVEVLGFGG